MPPPARNLKRAPLTDGFTAPAHDTGQVLEILGTKLFNRDRTLVQQVYWSIEHGLFELLGARGTASVEEAVAETGLTESGADSLLGVMCALGFVARSSDGRYSLKPAGRELFLSASPYYIGDQLVPTGYEIPPLYLKQGRSAFYTWARLRLIGLTPAVRFGSTVRLENQHARNLGACVAAVKTGEFAGARCVVDIAGGSGSFAIPFALEYPEARIILTDVPEGVKNVRGILEEHGLAGRIELLPVDAFRMPWPIPLCDGIFIGNFLHGFDDETCIKVCRESFERLDAGGQVWIHEMLWNDNRDGPLITALWHAAIRGVGRGRQRTAAQIKEILRQSGYADLRVVRTSGAYALVIGQKLRSGA